MTKVSKKGLLLLAAVLTLAAFAVPSTAPAATWGPAGTTHVLNSANFTAGYPFLGTSWQCTAVSLHVDVASPASASAVVTGATFHGCTGHGGSYFGACIITATGTGFPWTITGGSASAVAIDGVDIAFQVSGPCVAPPDAPFTLGGTLAAGAWSASGHSLTFASASGLSTTIGGGLVGATPVSGVFTDTSGTLTLS